MHKIAHFTNSLQIAMYLPIADFYAAYFNAEPTLALVCIIAACQQLGNDIERQGKANKLTTPRIVLGGIRTHDTLQSRQVLYQLRYKGNSADRGSNLQHNNYYSSMAAS